MPTLPTELRTRLEKTIVEARDVAEIGARAALEALAVHHYEPYPHMKPADRALRNHLRARARQLGDGYLTAEDAEVRRAELSLNDPLRHSASSAVRKGVMSIDHLAVECAYEHWHRMLFARFLAENHLLIEPEMRMAVSLEECTELAKELKTNLWALAGKWAQTMLPEIFRADDPVLKVPLATENQLKLDQLLNTLPIEVFTASDSLGWCYQFWQSKRKEQVNKAGNKIGADALPAVTQLFTEDYMVDFLLDNTLGAWWAGKKLTPEDAKGAESEPELRKKLALPGVTWNYLRFIRDASSGGDNKSDESSVPSASSAVKFPWRPAAGTFDGWPKTVRELKCLDPCCGSGHFLVAMFERLLAMRMAEEELAEKAAVAAVIRDNLFGLELDPRCTQLAAFSLALAAWRRVGHCALPPMHIACSGLAPNAREADWLELAGENEKLQTGMARLYRLFQNAPVLGSLINPRAGGGDLLEAGFQELRPLLEKALAQEVRDDTSREMAVTAQGIAKASEILAGQFTLVATNVPYLGIRKQCEELIEYCANVYPTSKADLATCFLERCLAFCEEYGSTALVTPQNWLFLGSYKRMRASLLKSSKWDVITRLGVKGFQTPMWDFNIVLLAMTRITAAQQDAFLGLDVGEDKSPGLKADSLSTKELRLVNQSRQLKNPDCAITLEEADFSSLLGKYSKGLAGVLNGDTSRFEGLFWEVTNIGDIWEFEQSTFAETQPYGGREKVILWEKGCGQLRKFAAEVKERLHDADRRGNEAWGKKGVVISQMGRLPASIYTGEKFDTNASVIFPRDQQHLLAVWTFCSSEEFPTAVRKISQKLNVTNATLVKVPFDLAYWQKVAAEKYPDGLPKPFSNDPTQWLFDGHPKGADQPLPVAVARLLGYRWPRQTGSSFPACPVLGPDGLERLADDDGIVCLPSVRGELPAAERLRELLAASYREDWKVSSEKELLCASGSEAGDLEEWLRNEFFAQHCNLFHQRPFIWHIWDGRKRDGFHALVNYHKLCEGNGKGRKLLESLTYSYLGDWITRQKDGVKRGEGGAEDRLTAAMELQKRLEAILAGEPPFDLFVRWKPLSQQPIGWNPDLNDGVRLNIRPFLASDLPNGRTGAGVLRFKPNIKWGKDRGKEPHRAKEEYPWFWGWDEQSVDFMGAKTFDGNRWNDCHYSNRAKQAAREGFTAEIHRGGR